MEKSIGSVIVEILTDKQNKAITLYDRMCVLLTRNKLMHKLNNLSLSLAQNVSKL